MEKTTGKIDEHTASWYIVYTAAKAEGKVEKLLKQSGFETYFPLQPVMRVWNHQKREVMVPIISRIVFVYSSKNDIELMTSTNKEMLLLQEKGRYLSISTEKMKALSNAIGKTNEFVEFVSEDFNIEAVEDEQFTDVLQKIDSQRYSTKFILPIKGLGVLWVKVED